MPIFRTGGTAPSSPPPVEASLQVPGVLRAVFVNTGDTLPANTPAWSLVVELNP